VQAPHVTIVADVSTGDVREAHSARARGR
jgi:hypothetical protein